MHRGRTRQAALWRQSPRSDGPKWHQRHALLSPRCCGACGLLSSSPTRNGRPSVGTRPPAERMSCLPLNPVATGAITANSKRKNRGLRLLLSDHDCGACEIAVLLVVADPGRGICYIRPATPGNCGMSAERSTRPEKGEDHVVVALGHRWCRHHHLPAGRDRYLGFALGGSPIGSAARLAPPKRKRGEHRRP